MNFLEQLLASATANVAWTEDEGRTERQCLRMTFRKSSSKSIVWVMMKLRQGSQGHRTDSWLYHCY